MQNIPEETLKASFIGFIRKLFCPHLMKASLKIIFIVTFFLGLYNDVIYIDLKTTMEYTMQKWQHGALEGGIDVLKTERHDFVKEITHGS